MSGTADVVPAGVWPPARLACGKHTWDEAASEAGVRPGWNQKVSGGWGGETGLSGPGETPGGWPPRGRETQNKGGG